MATAAALAVGVVAFAGPAGAADQFDDVEGNEFYGPAADWMFEQGLTTGYGGSDAQPSDVYEPTLEVDRAQIITFLWRMAGRPQPQDPDHGFSDVPPGTYYTTAVAWAAEVNLTTGIGGTEAVPGTTYEPHRSVTRGEAITLLWRYGGRPGVPPPPAYGPHTFTDTTPGAFYEPALNWAQAEGITTGYGGSHASPTTVFVPDGFLTRGELAALIWRYAGFPASDEEGCIEFGAWPCPEEDTTPAIEDAEITTPGTNVTGGVVTITYSEPVTCNNSAEAAAQFTVHITVNGISELAGAAIDCDDPAEVVLTLEDGSTGGASSLEYEEGAADDRVMSVATGTDAESPDSFDFVFDV